MGDRSNSVRLSRTPAVATPDSPLGKDGLRAVSARVRLPLLAGIALGIPVLLASAENAAGASRPAHVAEFLVYYGKDEREQVASYHTAVLNSEFGVPPPHRRAGMWLGYLSLGEVERGRDYFAEVEREGLLSEPNPNWPNARLIDLRAARWRERVVEQLIPAILARGCNGVFFDTLDDAEAAEVRDPSRNAGMIEGAARLIRSVRQRFPNLPIMINRGYAVLPRIAGQFDMLLGESVRTTFDAKTKTYQLVSKDGYLWQIQKMREARERDPQLRLFSLDYWDPEDRNGIARIYAEERANGFVPYVGTFDLTRIIPEP